ncbi:hypothetical protein FB45DRAFT_758123, partial [Roridomyces roridus]
DARRFWNKVTGFQSNHANDQKRLFELMKQYKERCDRETRGEAYIFGSSVPEFDEFLFMVTSETVREAGCLQAYDALSVEQQLELKDATWTRISQDIGEREFAKLTPEQKSDIDLSLWAGCCMHKELNAFKGGVNAMAEFWWDILFKMGLQSHIDLGPCKLYNRDNAASAKAAGTDAAMRAEGVSFGGAIKLVSLCGAIFRHKDRKRGQQDSLRFFFDLKVGFIICFPDTSNSHFQSHEEACVIVIVHLDLFIEFLDYVRDNKGTRTLNHMESNVFKGLKDIPTRTELCVVSLYWLAISVPYMREIRGHAQCTDNALLLCPLHQRLSAHLETLLQNPGLLLDSDASWETATLDGKMWQRPEAFYAVQQYAPSLPHLRELLIAFLIGARATWIKFSKEFAPGGALDKATPEQIEEAWLSVTNDLCVSSFGTWRQQSKANPTLSRAFYLRLAPPPHHEHYLLPHSPDFGQLRISSEYHLFSVIMSVQHQMDSLPANLTTSYTSVASALLLSNIRAANRMPNKDRPPLSFFSGTHFPSFSLF